MIMRDGLVVGGVPVTVKVTAIFTGELEAPEDVTFTVPL
jgi:hypothetical protein